MLILSRKKGESIKIGDDVGIFVAEIKGDKIRLGISAPESMRIYRTELYLTIKSDREASDKMGLLKVFQLSRGLRALGTKEGQKKEGKNGTA